VSLPIHVVRIDEDRPLLDLLPDLPDDERFVFVRDGDGVVAWGIAARIPVGTGPERFMRARSDLSEVLRDGRAADRDGEPAPLAFASFTFDPNESGSVLVVPRVAIVRRGGKTWRITVGASDPLPSSASGRTQTADRPRYGGSTVRDDAWLDAVARAVAAIDAGAYAKVVLARDLHLWSRAPFDVPAVLSALAERFPSCFTFLVEHLIGASPEMLLRRTGVAIASRVLAGTAPRGADAEEDVALGATLLASTKDRREHDLALASAVDALAPVCKSLDAPDAPSLVRLENVQHLGSDLVGTLGIDADGTVPHVLELLFRLHPTAAVGGTPREAAIAAIRELEGMSRGRYAGPVGWCTPDGDGEFAIALRCAEVRGDRARLFAGAGIVAGSLPEAELTETWLKLRAMTGVLGA
jgi:menaquinone-specific isochorismate synthase